MSILYSLTKAVFFPGTYMKAFFEHIICRILGINIYSADSYISKNVLSGHVSALPSDTAGKSFFFCFLPGLLNFIVGLPAVLLGLVTLGFLGIDIFDPVSSSFSPMFIVYCLIFLFGSSFFTNLFPYFEDARHMWHMIYGKDSKANIFWKIIVFFPSCIIMIGSFIEKHCISFFLYIGILAYWIIT